MIAALSQPKDAARGKSGAVKYRRDQPDADAAVHEALCLHDGDFDGFRGYVSVNHRASADAKLQQVMMPVARLGSRLSPLLQQYPNHDFYMSAAQYATPERKADRMLSLTNAWLDLDTYKMGVDVGDSAGLQRTLKGVMHLLAVYKVPFPSYVVRGRGLQLRWLFTQPVKPARFSVLQAALRRLAFYLDRYGADTNALHPTQLLRVCGSVHTGTRRRIECVYVNQDVPRIRFDEFVRPAGDPRTLLEWSYDDVREARERATREAMYAENERKRDAWRAEQRRNSATPGNHEQVLATSPGLPPAAAVGMKRAVQMERLAALRFGREGVPQGQRNEWTWLAAAAFSMVAPHDRQRVLELTSAWCSRVIPSYAPQEIESSAAAVLNKVSRNGGPGRWMMKTATAWARLNVTPAERAFLSIKATVATASKAAASRWNVGSMGLPPIVGQTFEQYRAETQRRQCLAAQRTNAMARKAREPLVLKAHEFAATGLSQRAIAARLGVSQMTVSRWLKAPGSPAAPAEVEVRETPALIAGVVGVARPVAPCTIQGKSTPAVGTAFSAEHQPDLRTCHKAPTAQDESLSAPDRSKVASREIDRLEDRSGGRGLGARRLLPGELLDHSAELVQLGAPA